MKKRLNLLVLTALLLALAACNSNGLPAGPTATDTAAALPTATLPLPVPPSFTVPPMQATPIQAAPTPSQASAVDTATSEPPATRGPASTEPLALELEATIVASMPATPTPDSAAGDGTGVMGVKVIPLKGRQAGNGDSLWAAFSYGIRRFDPEEKHFVAVYSHGQQGWRQLGKVELEDADYLDEGSVEQAFIEPNDLWLSLETGVGAHGGCYSLLRFDGTALQTEVSECGPSPDIGGLRDVNGDGTPDVVINTSDPYVICYACGVVYKSYKALSWNGRSVEEVMLQPLPASAPEKLRLATNRAIELAGHELWKEAAALIAETRRLSPPSQDPVYKWDAAFIELTAEARAEQSREGAFPLAAHIFYGDYPAALAALRPYNPQQIFSLDSPVFKDTPAEGYADSLAGYITHTTTLALQAEPDLAGAYFLRGWASYLADPTDPAAIADVQKAADLDPAEALFTQSAAYLKRRP